MPKPIDERLKALLQQYGEGPESVWDCHGTWVAYHAAIERMAAKAGIVFAMPSALASDPHGKHVALVVEATLGERREWSIGEAAPYNNKNAYPYAMAEKRAKDRVALKLLGMSGLVYSEEEADDFKAAAPQKSSAALKRENAWPAVEAQVANELLDVHTLPALETVRQAWRREPDVKTWPTAWKEALRDMFDAKEAELKAPNPTQEAAE